MARLISFFIIFFPKTFLTFISFLLFTCLSLLVTLSSLDLGLMFFFHIDKLLSSRFSSQNKLLFPSLAIISYYSKVIFISLVHCPFLTIKSFYGSKVFCVFCFCFFLLSCQINFPQLFHFFLLPFQMLSLTYSLTSLEASIQLRYAIQKLKLCSTVIKLLISKISFVTEERALNKT